MISLHVTFSPSSALTLGLPLFAPVHESSKPVHNANGVVIWTAQWKSVLRLISVSPSYKMSLMLKCRARR
jgi:hypothetical protein